jgi:hypothetical protein
MEYLRGIQTAAEKSATGKTRISLATIALEAGDAERRGRLSAGSCVL